MKSYKSIKKIGRALIAAAAVSIFSLLPSAGGGAAYITAYGAPVQADPEKEVSVETRIQYVCQIEAEEVLVYGSASEGLPSIYIAVRGEEFPMSGQAENGWVQVETPAGTGYLKLDGQACVLETAVEMVDQSAEARNRVVDYALQFVGNRYVWGGTSLTNGVDCSGFTRYILGHTAGVYLNRTAASQSAQGRSVSAQQARPGDLVFYGSGGSIDHVAIYMGDGRIVHASNAEVGIITSDMYYRTPVKICNVLGD